LEGSPNGDPYKGFEYGLYKAFITFCPKSRIKYNARSKLKEIHFKLGSNQYIIKINSNFTAGYMHP
jgi:hypothetical protein